MLAPLHRYSSFSPNSSSSCGEMAGPRSLISVWRPVVGSITAVFVRDSSRVRTNAFRIASSLSASTIRVPVAPPAIPVAITGWPSRLITRATLTPLPPGIVTWSTLRCRRPGVKFGTSRVLSSAGLSVMVMIMLGRKPNHPRIGARSARQLQPLTKLEGARVDRGIERPERGNRHSRLHGDLGHGVAALDDIELLVPRVVADDRRWDRGRRGGAVVLVQPGSEDQGRGGDDREQRYRRQVPPTIPSRHRASIIPSLSGRIARLFALGR